MPHVVSFAETVAPFLSFALILVAAACAIGAAVNGYRAGWIWLHGNTPVSDPVIAKALEGIKPPNYWIYALGLVVFGVLAFWCAIRVSHG